MGAGSAALWPESKVADLVAAWFEDLVTADRSPSTLDAYRGSLDRCVLPGLGELRIRELRPGVVDRFIRSVADTSASVGEDGPLRGVAT